MGGGILHPRHTSCTCEETSSTCTADAVDGDEKAKVDLFTLVTFVLIFHLLCVYAFLLGAWEAWL